MLTGENKCDIFSKIDFREVNDMKFLPAVVTKVPLTIQTVFPNIHPSFTKARISIGTPIVARMNSTTARLVRTRLSGFLTYKRKEV